MKYYITTSLLYLEMTIFTSVWRYENVIDDNPLGRGLADVFVGIIWPLYWNIEFMRWMV